MSKFEWTLDNILDMKKQYAEGVDVEQIADNIGASKNMVIGKLSAIGEYKKKPKAQSKAAKSTKADTVKGIEILLSVREGSLDSLSNATCKTLDTVKNALVKLSDKRNLELGK